MQPGNSIQATRQEPPRGGKHQTVVAGAQRAAEPSHYEPGAGSRLRSTPLHDRPRERLLVWGAAALRTAELLAILIRSGRPGESALQAGEKIANRWADCLERLPGASRGELHQAAASVQVTAYCQMMAGIELGRRVAAAHGSSQHRRPAIRSTADAISFCQARFARLASDALQEEFHVVCLNTSHHVLATHRISVGTLDSASAHPREVFRVAIKDAAAAMVVVHNHPAGDPEPSIEDLSVTQRLDEVADVVGIPILDHIVVAARGTISIREYQQQLMEPDEMLGSIGSIELT